MENKITDKMMDEMVTVKPLNTYLFVISSENDSGTYEINTDADEQTLKEIIKTYLVFIGKSRKTQEKTPSIGELLNKEGYYFSINVSVNK